MTGARKRWVKGRHKWKWQRPKSRPIMRHRRETLAFAYELAMWDQLSDEACAAFDRWLEDDDDQTFWQMAREDAWVNSASGGETNESSAESAGVRA